MEKGFIGLVGVLLGMVIYASSVLAAEDVVQFNRGVGVDPVTPAGTNTVRGVAPGGQIWVIRKFEADIEVSGAIKAEGQGLVLASGANFGTADGVTMVAATLFCGNPPTFTAHSTGGHPLSASGNFNIKDTLSGFPLSAACTSPVLLIRVFTGTPPAPGPWIAGGIIPEVGD